VATARFILGFDESADRLAEGLKEARQAVDLAPRDALAHATLALALAADDHLTPALEEARRAVDLDPGNAEGHVAVGIVLRLRRDFDASLAACRRAGDLAPEDPRVLVALADTLRELERYPEAMEIYGQAIDLDQDAIVPQLGAATALLKASHMAGARRMFDLLLTRWNYAQSRVRLGAAAFLALSQDFEGALDLYDGIDLPQNSSLPTLLVLFGKGYCLQQLQRDAEAEYFFSTVVERVPREYDGPARGRELVFQAYDNLVRYFAQRGRDRKVESLLKDACARPQAPTRLARRLASILDARGKAEEGAAFLEKAILSASPEEDPLELSESALAMARLRTAAGRRRLAQDSPAARALDAAASRLAACTMGVAHYRLARAQALAGEHGAALASLERARGHGYLPVEQMAQEPDFAALRQEAGYGALLKP